MKNVLCALALLGGLALAGSANAMPAASMAGLSAQAATPVQEVSFRYHRHHRFFFYGGGYYGGGYHFWKRYCFFHPYSWRCGYSGY